MLCVGCGVNQKQRGNIYVTTLFRIEAFKETLRRCGARLNPSSSPDAYELCLVEADEVRRRWDALGRPTMDRFNQRLVAECLGSNVAAAVFRRPGGVNRGS